MAPIVSLVSVAFAGICARVVGPLRALLLTTDPNPAVYGAYGYDLRVSINGGDNGFSGLYAESNRWDSHWSLDGWDYAVSVRASSGDTRKGAYTTTGSAKARPKLAPPPQNIRVQASEKAFDGIRVSWDPPKGEYTDSIIGYNIILWDWEPRHCQFINGAAFKKSPAKLSWPMDNTNYLIALVTWNSNGEGLPAIGPNVIPGTRNPPRPSGLAIDTIDATSVRWVRPYGHRPRKRSRR